MQPEGAADVHGRAGGREIGLPVPLQSETCDQNFR
jgi:hypothetical protein